MSVRERAEQLRALHHGDEPLVLPNIWDAASAVVVASLPACRAIATSSAGVATTLGYPDGERISAAEMLAMVARIARVVALPVTADLEAGYGDVERTVRGAVQAGAAGLNLEDRNGPMDAHVERLRTARGTSEALDVPLVLNARIDVFLPGGSGDVDEAVDRGNAYLDAGADCAYPIGVTDREVVRRLARGIRGPINVHAAADAPSVAELAELGVRRISVGSLLHRAALGAAREAARELLETGTYEWARAAVSSGDVAAPLG